ncbi:MAG: hypothetical protein RLZ12_776 [Bacillota bacterium]|jgi:hypothetical protein
MKITKSLLTMSLLGLTAMTPVYGVDNKKSHPPIKSALKKVTGPRPKHRLTFNPRVEIKEYFISNIPKISVRHKRKQMQLILQRQTQLGRFTARPVDINNFYQVHGVLYPKPIFAPADRPLLGYTTPPQLNATAHSPANPPAVSQQVLPTTPSQTTATPATPQQHTPTANQEQPVPTSKTSSWREYLQSWAKTFWSKATGS